MESDGGSLVGFVTCELGPGIGNIGVFPFECLERCCRRIPYYHKMLISGTVQLLLDIEFTALPVEPGGRGLAPNHHRSQVRADPKGYSQ